MSNTKKPNSYINRYWANRTIVLDYRKALFIPQEQALLVADLHIGKEQHFRKSGMAVPAALSEHTLNKLKQVVQEYRPSTIYYLGDLFHSYANSAWRLFREFLKDAIETDHVLIRGNHDLQSDQALTNMGLKVYPKYALGNLKLRHEMDPPMQSENSYTIGGHIHPVVKLRGVGGDSMRLPCFAERDHSLLLPAFGTFTGGCQLNSKDYAALHLCWKEGIGTLNP